jgi:hypothetical protein
VSDTESFQSATGAIHSSMWCLTLFARAPSSRLSGNATAHRAFAFGASTSYIVWMSELKRIQARARELARSGRFFGWRPLEFELSFEEGFSEARDWLDRATTQEELDRICRKARTRRLSGQTPRAEPL